MTKQRKNCLQSVASNRGITAGLFDRRSNQILSILFQIEFFPAPPSTSFIHMLHVYWKSELRYGNSIVKWQTRGSIPGRRSSLGFTSLRAQPSSTHNISSYPSAPSCTNVPTIPRIPSLARKIIVPEKNVAKSFFSSQLTTLQNI